MLALWLAPLALGTATQWRPSGFYYEMSLNFERESPEWLPGLSPASRAQFERNSSAHSDHLRDVGEQRAK